MHSLMPSTAIITVVTTLVIVVFAATTAPMVVATPRAFPAILVFGLPLAAVPVAWFSCRR